MDNEVGSEVPRTCWGICLRQDLKETLSKGGHSTQGEERCGNWWNLRMSTKSDLGLVIDSGWETSLGFGKRVTFMKAYKHGLCSSCRWKN